MDTGRSQMVQETKAKLAEHKDQLLQALNDRTDPQMVGGIIGGMMDNADKEALFEMDLRDAVEIVREAMDNPEEMNSRDAEQWVEQVIESIA